MRKNIGKSISNLDLKLLDVKFIAIDDNQTYLTEALQSVKRSKNWELPSLLRPKEYSPNSLLEETKIIDQSIFDSEKNRNTVETNDQTDLSILTSFERENDLTCFKKQRQANSQSKSNFAKINQQKQDSDELEQINQQIRIKRSQKLPNQQNNTLSESQQDSQQRELQKYRRKIQQIKKQNLQIHTKISKLYRNKINQHKEHFKKIKQIQPYKLDNSLTKSDDKNLPNLVKQINNISSQHLRINKVLEAQKLRTQISSTSSPSKVCMKQRKQLSPFIEQKKNFYENLRTDSPFKQELQKIHKKMITNNLHKNFQQYLVANNKRVPEFIKNLRN